KAVCLVQLAGDLELFPRYEQDRDLLRRAIQAEVAGEIPVLMDAPAPHLLGKPTPIAAPDARSGGELPHRPPSEARPVPGEQEAARAAAPPQARVAVLAVAVFMLVLIGAGAVLALISQSGSTPTSDPPPVSP